MYITGNKGTKAGLYILTSKKKGVKILMHENI